MSVRLGGTGRHPYTRRQLFVYWLCACAVSGLMVTIGYRIGEDPPPPVRVPKVSDDPPVIGTTRYPLTIDGDIWWCLTDQPPERGEPLRVGAETRLLDCMREVNYPHLAPLVDAITGLGHTDRETP